MYFFGFIVLMLRLHYEVTMIKRHSFIQFSLYLLLFVSMLYFASCSRQKYFAIIINEEFNSAASPITVEKRGKTFNVLNDNTMLQPENNSYDSYDIEIFDTYQEAVTASKMLELVHGFILYTEHQLPVHVEKSLHAKRLGSIQERSIADVLSPIQFSEGFGWIRIREHDSDYRGWVLVTEYAFITNMLDVNNTFTLKRFYTESLQNITWKNTTGDTLKFSKLLDNNFYIESIIDSTQHHISIKHSFPIDSQQLYIPSIDTKIQWSSQSNFVYWINDVSELELKFKPEISK